MSCWEPSSTHLSQEGSPPQAQHHQPSREWRAGWGWLLCALRGCAGSTLSQLCPSPGLAPWQQAGQVRVWPEGMPILALAPTGAGGIGDTGRTQPQPRGCGSIGNDIGNASRAWGMNMGPRHPQLCTNGSSCKNGTKNNLLN